MVKELKQPPPQITGKYCSDCTGLGRFSIRGQLQQTPKFSFKSVNSFVRYQLTNFFAQKETHTYTRQTKNQFSWLFSVSSQEMCLAQLRILDGISIRDINEVCWLLPHELRVLVFFSIYLDGGQVGGHRNAVNSSMQQRRFKCKTTYFATEWSKRNTGALTSAN